MCIVCCRRCWGCPARAIGIIAAARNGDDPAAERDAELAQADRHQTGGARLTVLDHRRECSRVLLGLGPGLEDGDILIQRLKQIGIAKGGQEFSIYGVPLLPQGLDAA
jgi:hypothetical protein